MAGMAPPVRADVMDDANDAVRAQENGDYERAFELYTRVVDAGELPEGDNLLAYCLNNRGLIHVRKKEYDQAMADFNAAIEHRPDYIFYFNRGRLLMHLGRDQEAIQDFTQSLMRNMEFTRAFHARGLAKLNTGDTRGGLADLEKAQVHFPFLKSRSH